MSFVEVDLFGVYVAPLSIMMAAAYGLLFCFRQVAVRLGWFDHIWHPGLFELALYVIILSAVVLLAGRMFPHV